ncbi:MAG: metallophosphoesterase [Calditrichaeota bacterium]|nr:metallophosphoesterase [Calditrichota bacterium]
MKIAHISDLHFGKSREQNDNIEALVGSIKDFGIDHLAITGDLTACGSAEQYKGIISIFENNNLFSAERLTVIPGNHDLFNYILRYFHSATDILKRMHRLPAAIYNSLKFNIEKYQKELQQFYFFFQETFFNSIKPAQQAELFPFAKELIEDTVLITIDSNTAIGLKKNNAASNGCVHLDSLEILLQDARIRDKKKIVMMHHYLQSEKNMIKDHGRGYSRFMKLENRKETTQLLIDNDIDLVLHGHHHENGEYWINGDMLRVLNGGGSYCGPSWNLIEITADDIKIEVIDGVQIQKQGLCPDHKKLRKRK